VVFQGRSELVLRLGVHKISHYLDAVVEQIGEDRDWEAKMASW
jgi:hypothetical protein